ncbi:MAG: macro domain-containing protein [Terriglobia bacterium]
MALARKKLLARIHLQQGDLTETDVDAIVNAANNDLQLGGGVAGAIRRKGGAAIQQQCDRLGPITIGEAAITSGGTLKARYVIHAASMRLGGCTTADSLRAATRNSLQRAEEKSLTSIAFPAVGTGVAGFPLRHCAEIMLDEVVRHLRRHTALEKVYFVLYDQTALRAFQEVWEKMKERL